MANPMKGEAVVKVEAGEFTLAFDLGACVAIEDAMDGKPLQDVLETLEGDRPNVSTLLKVIWAGLKKHHDLSIEDVGHVVGLAEMELWGAAIGRAFSGVAGGTAKPARPRTAKAGA